MTLSHGAARAHKRKGPARLPCEPRIGTAARPMSPPLLKDRHIPLPDVWRDERNHKHPAVRQQVSHPGIAIRDDGGVAQRFDRSGGNGQRLGPHGRDPGGLATDRRTVPEQHGDRRATVVAALAPSTTRARAAPSWRSQPVACRMPPFDVSAGASGPMGVRLPLQRLRVGVRRSTWV